ncbi:MAG TPA: Dickkopf N-terminal cysteine-rich domain-containing protein [Kofleriaceae bacterium]|nr:Dickkopf N-terminal cysteine-rich domain-containing protein [Kofleriaceae bacterium]
MRARILTAIVAGGLSLAGGCSNESSSVPLADAAARLGQASCLRLRECNVLGALLLSQTTCEQLAYSYRNGTLAHLDDWVAAGTVVYDADAMADCLDDVAGAVCSAFSADVIVDNGRCAQAFAGQVDAGGACEDTTQCRAGNYCADELSCPGTCQPRIAAAGACTLDAECAVGLTCAGGHCVALGQTGATCGSGDLPQCAMGFQCDTGRDPATCQPITRTAASGAPCNPNGGVLCASGLVCAEVNLDPATYQCVTAAMAGGACFRAVPSGCPLGQVCVVENDQDAGLCTTQAAVGQPCLTGSAVLFGCAAGAACDYDTDLCVAMVDNGEACTSNAQCFGDCVGNACEDALACD